LRTRQDLGADPFWDGNLQVMIRSSDETTRLY